MASRGGVSDSNTIQAQLFDTGRIVFSYGSLTLPHAFADDVLVGVSPGGGSAVPAESNLSDANPFDVHGALTVFDMIRPSQGEQWNMADTSFRFAPSMSGGSTTATPTSGGTVPGTDSGAMPIGGAPSTPCEFACPVPNVTISKSGPSSVSLGSTFSYTVTVSNSGDPVSGATVSDFVPAGLTITSVSPSPPCSWSGQLVTCAPVTLPPTFTLTITVRADICGTKSNQAGVTWPGGSLSSNVVTTNVTCTPPAVTISKSGPASVNQGQQFVYTVTVTNSGGTVTGATVTDTVPPGLTIISTSPGNPPCSVSGQTVTCAPLTLGNFNLSITVQADTCGTKTNQASVAWPGGSLSSNVVTTNIICTPTPNITISKSGPASVNQGQTFVYTVNVTNSGATVSGATVTDTVPPGLTIISTSPGNPPCFSSGQTVTCTPLTLGNFNLSITVQANTCGTKTNQASVSWPGGALSSSPVTTNVLCTPIPDLEIIKAAAATGVTPGGTINYTISVINHGPGTANGITVTDTLSGATLAVPTGCTGGGTSFTCSISSLAQGGAPWSRSFTATVPTAASCSSTVTNSATVSPGGPDPQPNSDSVITNVVCAPSVTPVDQNERHDVTTECEGDENCPSPGSLVHVDTQEGDPVQDPEIPSPGLDLDFIYTGRNATGRSLFIAKAKTHSGGPPPSTMTAQLTIGTWTSAVFTYNTGALTPDTEFVIAIPYNANNFITGRYQYTLQAIASGVTTNTIEYINIVSDRPTATIQQSPSRIGNGWSLNLFERIYPVTGGAILELGDGTTRFFPSTGSNTYGHAAGEFSTLVYSSGNFRRTLRNGTTIHYNNDDLVSSRVEANGRTISFSYKDANADGKKWEISTITAPDTNRKVTFTYEPSGLRQLQSVSAPGFTTASPRVTTFTHDGNGNVRLITLPDTSTWDYRYEEAADPRRLSRLIAPREVSGGPWEEKLTYDTIGGSGGLGFVTKWELRSQGGSVLHYEDVNSVEFRLAPKTSSITPVLWTDRDQATVTSPDSNNSPRTVTLTLDRFGNAKSLNESVGAITRITTFTRNVDGQLTNLIEPATLADPFGRVTTFQYLTTGDLREVDFPDGGVVSYTYDSAFSYARVKTISQKLSATETAVTTFAYDSQGRMTSVTDPLGFKTSFTYYKDDILKTIQDARGNVTTFTRDSYDRMTTINLPSTKTAELTFTYASGDTTNNPVSFKDERGLITTFTYDPLDRVTSVTNPLGEKTSFVYDKMGNLVSVADPRRFTATAPYIDSNGNTVNSSDPAYYTTRYTYDALNHVTKVTNAMNEVTSYTYNPAKLPATMVDPLGNITTYQYDALDRLNKITDPVVAVTTLLYELGTDRVTTVTRSLDATTNSETTFTYDRLDRVTSVRRRLDAVNVFVTTFTYDLAGRLTVTTDPLGNRTTYAYDKAGQLTSISYPNSVLTQHRFTYDAVGNVTQFTDALNKVTTFAYDVRNRLVTMTDALGNLSTWTYNVGLLESYTDEMNHKTTYTYDKADRLSSVTDPLSHVTTLNYDSAGNLTEVIDPLSSRTTFSYDAANRVTKRQEQVDTLLTGTTTYTYDKAGRLTSVIDPLSHTTSFAYDNANRLTKITRPDPDGTGTQYTSAVTTFVYDLGGRRTQVIDPEGKTTTLQYDRLDRLTKVTDPLNHATTYLVRRPRPDDRDDRPEQQRHDVPVQRARPAR